jgi:hypothetical protein
LFHIFIRSISLFHLLCINSKISRGNQKIAFLLKVFINFQNIWFFWKLKHINANLNVNIRDRIVLGVWTSRILDSAC